MSVEIDGVKGYEYQYLCTILIALSLIKNGYKNISLFIEKIEDAVFEITENENRKTIYFQGKKHDNDISLDDLCNWLAHFGDRQATDSLLSRLKDENTFVVFYSFGRCTDIVRDFAKYNRLSFLNETSLNSSFVEEFKTKLLSSITGTSPLMVQRKEHLNDVVSSLNDHKFKLLLKRVCISELYLNEKVEYEIGKILNSNFLIRPKDINNVISCLDKIVRNGRDSGEDIISDIKDIINKNSYKLIKNNQHYIAIPKYDEIMSCFEQNNVLLLTGLPFSGKTITAQYIAESYLKNGYNVKEVDELSGDEGATCFICNSYNDKRVVIISDPFGSYEKNRNSGTVKTKLEELISIHSSSDRRVIVTSRKDILHEVFGKNDTNDCEINGHKWFDLSMSDIKFAKQCWNEVFGSNDKSEVVFENISDLLAKENSVFIEAGEIYKLRNEYRTSDALYGISTSDLISKARTSSSQIAERIKEAGSNYLYAYITLSLCCNTIRGIKINDLPYVFSDVQVYPAINKKIYQGHCIILGGELSEIKTTFPEYPKDISLSSEIKNILEEFKNRGYIFINEGYVFWAHPIYHYAGKILLKSELSKTFNSTEKVECIVEHCLSSLNKNINICAMNIIDDCIGACEEKNKFLFNLVSLSLYSIFPASRDRALLILERNFDRLDLDRQDEVVKAINNDMNNEYLLWHDGEPFYNQDKNIYFDFCSFFESDEKNLLGDFIDLSVEDVHKALFSWQKNDLPFIFLKKCIKFDESIIRQQAIYLILKNHTNEIDNIDEYLINDENSNVIISACKGALESFDMLSNDNKEKLISFYCSQLKKVSVSIMSSHFLEDYFKEKCEVSCSNDEISAWCRIFTCYLMECPQRYVKVDEYHMGYSIEQIIKRKSEIDKIILVNLVAAWEYWLNKASCPNDYGMSIMDFMLNALNPDDRKVLYIQMLKSGKTSIITSHVYHIINNWEILSDDEKIFAENLIASDRRDVIWIKAMALTSKIIPSEISSLIIGCDVETMQQQEVISRMREINILEPCLNIFCGYPQPLWYNGYHHQNKRFWCEIISFILLGKIVDKAFEISVRLFIDDLYNSFSIFETSNLIWQCLLEDKTKRERVFKQLLRVSATQNQRNKKMWDEYLKKCDNEEFELTVKKIIENIEAIEYYQFNEFGILDQFDEKMFLDEIYSQIDKDYSIYKVCMTAYNMVKCIEDIKINLHDDSIFENFDEKPDDIMNEIKSVFEQKIIQLYHKYPPRMQFTNEIIKHAMNKLKMMTPRITDMIEKRRNELIDMGRARSNEFDDEYKLNNWIE